MDLQAKLQFQNYLKLFYSKRWYILIFTIIGTSAAVIFLNITRNEYIGMATLIIEKSKNNLLGDDVFYNPGLETTLQNHIEHLKSYKISKQVFNYIKENHQNYQFEFEIFKDTNQKLLPDDRAKINWLRSRLNATILVRNADLIRLEFTSYSAIEAASIVNIYQEVYIEESLNFVEAELISLKKYLIDKIYEKETLLLDSENEVNLFKQRENINQIDAQTSESISTIAAITAKKAQYQISLDAALEAKRTIEEQIKNNQEKLKNSNIEINTNYLSRLTEEVSTKRSQRLKMDAQLSNIGLSRETFQAQLDNIDNEIKALEDQLNEQTKLKSSANSIESSFKLAEDLQSKYLDYDIQIKSLQKSITSIEELLQTNKLSSFNLPDKQLQLARLTREVEKHKKISIMLLDELEKTEIQLSSKKNNVKIIDKALPVNTPIYPRKTIVLFSGFMLSFLSILGTLFLIEYLDNTIKTEDEIEIFGIYRLGLIPKIISENKDETEKKENINRIVSHANPNSMVAEAYKALRTNLSFQLRKDGNRNSFLISSCGPQEGKSTTVTNVAISFAQQGKRVIVVDADLRRPVIHNLFNLKKENGFVDVIMNEMDLDDVYKETGIDNLYAITSGTIPPNPSELLSLSKVDNTIERLKKEFDIVLFDTPPVIAVTDAAILSEKIDNVIMVIRASVTDRDMLIEAKSKLTTYSDNLIGCVLNDFNLERHYGYRYQYYNYYHNTPKKS